MTELEVELFTVLDIIVAEFVSDPMSVQCFDPLTVERAKKVIGENRSEWMEAMLRRDTTCEVKRRE